ncbi:LysE family translocator (plasmid) [Paroceanicella profunda]|uniref:LysE family translocator n=1 Tax=Paroceanicella profunda TaxID=2579971 RepID=A0A5B8G0M2_9RHOB|nr:LysE family translocator [Paroceanicella profunda]QDL94666.1 LysE family translocator [Paroceanicella profunda]
MDLHAALALAGTTAALVALPGPNVALIIATTLGHGQRAGIATVLGTTLGVGLQLVLVALGLAALLEHAAGAFSWLRWLGVAYLFWLGWRSWRRGAAAAEMPAQEPRPSAGLLLRGLLVAAVNPKTLLFSAAFLPQFVGPDAGAAGLVQAAAVHLAVMLAGDLLWVTCAERARPALTRLGPLRHRLTGGLFFGAGAGLALARIGRQAATP